MDLQSGGICMNIDSLMVPELNEELIASKIYKIRGQKVMLDFELAEIYGYTTTRFNEQVKNNIEKPLCIW